MRPIIIAFVLLLCVGHPVMAQPGPSIEIFLVDPETGAARMGVSQGRTTLLQPYLRSLDVSIQARLAGVSFAAALFYVEGLEGLPPEWRLSHWTPAEFVTVGFAYQPYSPTENEPLVRRFAVSVRDTPTGQWECRDSEWVELARVRLLSFSQSGTPADLPSNSVLRIVGGDPPLDPQFPCPLFAQCDPPIFPLVCAAGGQFIINPQDAPPIAVASATWSGVKGLYR